MHKDAATLNRSTLVVLLAAGLIVHAALGASLFASEPPRGGKNAATAAKGPASTAKSSIAQNETVPAQLPVAVRDMIDAIMSAVHSGRIEELSTAVDWNEMKPDLAPEGPVADPVAYWKGISADGNGRTILAVLANLLQTAPSNIAAGKDVENNRVFVWPGFADKPLGKLRPAEEVDLYRIAPAADAAAMKAKGKYAGWRLAIGADGTWHSFRKID